jgi:hypothetical protein
VSPTPGKAVRAGAWRNHDGPLDDDGTGRHDNGAAVGVAPAVFAAMESGAAAPFSMGLAKACEAGCQQRRHKNCSHLSSFVWIGGSCVATNEPRMNRLYFGMFPVEADRW